MITEEDARKSWCPFGRGHLYDNGGDDPRFAHAIVANRGKCTTLCIASRCMAWRWEGSGKCTETRWTNDELVRDQNHRFTLRMVRPEGPGWIPTPEQPTAGMTRWTRTSANDSGRGYCGLAGAP